MGARARPGAGGASGSGAELRGRPGGGELSGFSDASCDGPTKELSFSSQVFEFYKRSLDARPRLTNGVVSCCITICADSVAQAMEFENGHGHWRGFDLRRNRALASTAFAYNGFVLTSWLLALNKSLPGQEFKTVMAKLAATQTILQPLVYVPFFFIFHGLMLGQAPEEIYTRLTNDYFALLFRLWSLFMPTRFLMFLIIPVQYQVLWDSSIAFIWQVALSLFDAKNRQAVSEGLISATMDFEGFGYMQARDVAAGGSSFLPKDRAYVGPHSGFG